MLKKNYLYTFLAALLLAVVAFLFFTPDVIEGNVLQQQDTIQGMANGQEGIDFKEKTGETTRWTNSLFSGMPNFQIAPSYPANNVLAGFARVYSLWLPAPANLLFAMMLGFFIMCLCFRMRWVTALYAAVAWGFSTYFIIIIGAGHIWKFMALSYVPPTIGGMALLYRGKYVAGSALTALFAAMQLHSNHPQMSYYFAFVMVALVIAWLWQAIKEKRVASWCLATVCAFLAGIFAVGANSASLYNSYEYSKETIRGKATELSPADGSAPVTDGLDKDYITAWSYGTDETFSLLIPNVKGGATIKPEGGKNTVLGVNQTDKAQKMNLSREEMQFISQFPQYFGEQPMTNGPVYVGAFVFVLALLALFVVEGPVKWALFAVSVLAVLLSWGHNFSGFTYWFIDNFPGYNKFRTVSSILVIVEFTIPLLAAMCIKKILDTPDFFNKYRYTFYTVSGFCTFVCLLGWVSPGVFGTPFSNAEMQYLSEVGVLNNPQYANILNTISESRLSLVSGDSLRSLVFILLGSAAVLLWSRGFFRGSKTVFVGCLTVLAIIDLYPVNKRYVNSDNFIPASTTAATFAKTAADEAILQDTTNYRVMDVEGFGDARSSYFHKTIGGYHAAKLTRYNDLIDRQILKGNMNVLNMLNAKYFIQGDEYSYNPDALGNAWFIDRITYVATPDAEMNMLDTINPGLYAVSDKVFESVLGQASTVQPGDTIFETSYAPNRLTYKSKTAKENIAVFSEVYFPWGWKATVDGKPSPVGRVDYVLRAMRVPAGEHEIVFTFDPESLKTTNTLAIISLCVIGVVCAFALAMWGMKLYGITPPALRKPEGKDKE